MLEGAQSREERLPMSASIHPGPDNPPRYPPTHAGHWTETMHTHVYAYREAERGTIPNPELA